MKNIKNSGPYFLLFLIIAAGTFLRFWGTIHGSFAFTYDVGRDLLAVQKMIEEQKVSLLGPTMGIEGLFYGPWWYLFLAIPFLLSDGNPYFVVSVITLVGILMIPLAYLLGSQMAGKFSGLLLALLVAASPTLVNFSTQIWSPDLLPPFMLASLTILYFLLKRKLKNILWWILLGLFAALTFEMEASFGFFFTVALFLTVLVWTVRHARWRRAGAFLTGLFLVELPRFAFEVRHNFLQTKALTQVFKLGSQGEENGIFEKIKDTSILFWQNWSETLGAQNLWISLMAVSVTFVTLLVFWKRFKDEEQFLVKTLFLTSLVTFVGFTVYPRSLWLHYFVGLPLIFLLFFFMAILLLSTQLPKRVFVASLALFIFLTSRPVGTYQAIRQPFFAGDAAVFRNQVKVLDALYQDANGEKFNYVAYTPPLYTYTWDYLFDWYGEKKYGYKPDKETAKLFYLIIEPEFEHPERLTDWFKLREGDGKIVKSEAVAGGIILEKRVH